MMGRKSYQNYAILFVIGFGLLINITFGQEKKNVNEWTFNRPEINEIEKKFDDGLAWAKRFLPKIEDQSNDDLRRAIFEWKYSVAKRERTNEDMSKKSLDFGNQYRKFLASRQLEKNHKKSLQ